MIGIWYLSNGSPVCTQSVASPLKSYNSNVIGQVGLVRCAGLFLVQGLYCIIPKEEGISQTLCSYIQKYYFIYSGELYILETHTEMNCITVFLKRNAQ